MAVQPEKWRGEFNTAAPAQNEHSPDAVGLRDGGFAMVYVEDGRIVITRHDAFGEPVGLSPFITLASEPAAIAPKIALLSNGDVVVTWAQASATFATNFNDVFAQVLRPSNGSLGFLEIGPQITVASGVGDQREPEVAARNDGTFMVTWSDKIVAFNNGEILGTLLNNNGTVNVAGGVPQNNITLSAISQDAQLESSVAVLNNGKIVTAYSDAAGDRDVFFTIASTITSGIDSITSPVQVNTVELGSGGLSVRQDQPSVTALSNGGFVVVFVNHFSAGDLDVRGRIFDANGVPAGNDFIIDNLSFIQTAPSVTALPDGSFAVSYSDSRDSVSGSSAIDANITTRVFTNAGAQVGNAVFNVNATQTGVQGNSTVTALDDGRYLITWTDENGTGGGDVRYQIMDAREGAIGVGQFGETIVGRDTGQTNPDDTLNGNDNANKIFGLGGSDSITAGRGDDILDGGSGADNLFGDGGNDTYVLAGFSDDTIAEFEVFIDAFGGIDTITSTISRSLDSFRFIENLILLGTGNINGSGDEGANTITGNSGNNILTGGVDTLADRLIGGAGNDTYNLGSSANDIVIEVAGVAGGVDTITSTISRTLAANVENLVLLGTATNGAGNTLANTITGNAGKNVLTGGADGLADRLIGGAGNDVYILGAATGDIVVEAAGAAAGIDTVTSTISRSLGSNVENLTLQGTAALGGFGNTLANTITGNSGANLLAGGLGNDTLTGGAGVDSFFFNTAPSASNIDRITDFSAVADTIRLENTGAGLFTALANGTLNGAFFKANTAGVATELDDRIIYDTDSGALFYDSNGSAFAGAVQFATLVTRPAITAADFLVI